MADILDAAAQKVIDDAAKNAVPSDPATPTTPSTPPTEPSTPVAQPIPSTPAATPSVEPPKAEEIPVEKPLIISVEPTATQTTTVKVEPTKPTADVIPPMPSAPPEPPPTPAVEQSKAKSSGMKSGKKGGKMAMIAGVLLLLIFLPVATFFIMSNQQNQDVRSRAGNEVGPALCIDAYTCARVINGTRTAVPNNQCSVGLCKTATAPTIPSSCAIKSCPAGQVPALYGDNRCPSTCLPFSADGGTGGGGEPPATQAPTQPPTTTTCSTAYTCGGKCETDQTTITTFENTWCDPVARWKWQACGEGSEPTAQKPNCGGTTPAASGGNTPPRCTVFNTQANCSSSNLPGTSACSNVNGVTVYCCPTGYNLQAVGGSHACRDVNTGALPPTPTPGGSGGGGTSGGSGGTGGDASVATVQCRAGQTPGAGDNSCIITSANATSMAFRCNLKTISGSSPIAHRWERCSGAGTDPCNENAPGYLGSGDLNGSANNWTIACGQEITGSGTFDNFGCGRVQVDVQMTGAAGTSVAGLVYNYGTDCSTGGGGGGGGCGNYCSPGGPWAGTCCNSLSEGPQCQHTWIDGSNAACNPSTPTPPAGGQCTRISVYKGNDKVTNLSSLKAGDQITIGVAGHNADKGRIRVNGGTFTETTTKNSQDEYTINFTIPTGVTQFTIEAEVYAGGAWH